MFCLLAVKETSCVCHCNVVTLCVVISGCFNFKSIKKSEGGRENAIWTILWLFMELGLDPPPISRLAHIVYQPKWRTRIQLENFIILRACEVPADWIFAKRTDRLWVAAAKEEEDYLISVASQSDTIASFVLVNKVQVYCDEFSI